MECTKKMNLTQYAPENYLTGRYFLNFFTRITHEELDFPSPQIRNKGDGDC